MDARAPDSTPEKFAQAGMNRRPGHWAKRQVSSYRCGGEGWLGIQTQAGATGGWWEVLMNALLTHWKGQQNGQQTFQQFYLSLFYAPSIVKSLTWAASSVGRAPRSQRGGRGFKSRAVHHVFNHLVGFRISAVTPGASPSGQHTRKITEIWLWISPPITPPFY